MADVIAICGRCINHKDVILNVRQMLLPIFLADVIAMVHDRCCYHHIMADVIALCLFYGRCYCHVVFGRCCCQFYVEDVKPHIVFQLFATSVMADVIAQWQMEWPLQGDFIQL